MAFRELNKGTHARGRGPAVGTINAMVLNNGVVRFAIAEDILTALGSPSAFRILLGEGEHADHVAFLPTEAGRAGAFNVRKQSGGRQGSVHVTASRIDVASKSRPTVSLPIKLSKTAVIVDLRPLNTAHLSLAA